LLQVRNKQVTKHFTEKTVKEIWKDRMAEHKSGKATDLCDFVCNHFQKKIGIMSAVIEVFPSDVAKSCECELPFCTVSCVGHALDMHLS